MKAIGIDGYVTFERVARVTSQHVGRGRVVFIFHLEGVPGHGWAKVLTEPHQYNSSRKTFRQWKGEAKQILLRHYLAIWTLEE